MSVTKIETHEDLRTKLADMLLALDEGLESIKKAETAVKLARTMIQSTDSETRTMKAQHSAGIKPADFGQLRIAK